MTFLTARPVTNIPFHKGLTQETLLQSRESPINGWPDLYQKGEQLARDTDAWAHGEHEYVFGAGDIETAKILVIGEAPGNEERKHLIPFIGPAGKTLTESLSMVGIHRTIDCFLTNVVSLAPAGMGGEIGKPFPADMVIERERILDVYNRMKPKIVIFLGKYPVLDFMCDDFLKGLAKDNKSFQETDLVLKNYLGFYEDGVKDFFDCPVAVNYHPSYILRRRRAAERDGIDISGDLQAYLEFFHHVKVNYLDK